jgi:hypothetical protein
MRFETSLLVLVIFAVPGIAHAGDGPTCRSCAVPQLKEMSGAIGALKDDAELHRKEKKELKEGKKELTKALSQEQATAYASFYKEFENALKAYKKFYPNAKAEDFAAALKDPSAIETAMRATLKEKESAKKGLNASVKKNLETGLASVVAASQSAWARDQELSPILVEASDKSASEDRKKLFQNRAEEHFEKNSEVIESWVESSYEQAKFEYLKGKEDYSEKQLKNLRVNFKVQKNNAKKKTESEEISYLEGDIYDLDHPDFKGKSLTEVSKIIQARLPENEPAYCFARPATKAEIIDSVKGSTPPSETPPDPKLPDPEIIPQREIRATCDIAQSFPDNETSLTQDSKKALEDCIKKVNKNGSDGQSARCEHGVESIHASVKSCASTLRPKDWAKGVSNLDLATKRAQSMAGGFEAAAQSILGVTPEIDGTDPESFASFQNVFTKGENPELTGTCGPQPPASFGKEDWLSEALENNTNSCLQSKEIAYGECLKKFKGNPQQLWQCQPKTKDEALAEATRDLKERISASIGAERERLNAQLSEMERTKDPYSSYRKASIEVAYVCKLPPKEDLGRRKNQFGVGFVEREWETPPGIATTCGVFVKCVPIEANIYTSEPAKRDWNWNLNWFGNQQKKPKAPKKKSGGKRSAVKCPDFSD